MDILVMAIYMSMSFFQKDNKLLISQYSKKLSRKKEVSVLSMESDFINQNIFICRNLHKFWNYIVKLRIFSILMAF